MHARLSQNSPLGKKPTPTISRRRKRSLSTGRYWRNRIVRGRRASGQSVKSYVYLNGTPLARIDNTSVYYYHTDHLGTPQGMTDSSGNVVWRANYEPFGKATVTINTITNNLRLDGYWDQEVNLSYNGARYRDLNGNRFLSSDPIGLAGGLNTYVAVGNNPLRYIDPSGLSTELLPDPENMPQTPDEIRSSAQMVISLVPGSGIPEAIETGGLTGAALLALEVPGLKSLKVAGNICGKAAAKSGVGEGTRVFRVWGDDAKAFGKSWTTVDPRTVPNYRSAAGLPNQNSGRFLSEGILQDTSGIRLKTADPLHGNAGGLPEVVIPNPQSQIQLRNVQGLNPHF